MRHGLQGSRLGAQDRFSLFLVIPFGCTVITLYPPYVPLSPRGSTVQVDSIIAACTSAQHTISNVDLPRRELGISLVAKYFIYSSGAGLQ